jgi:ABC-type Zn2+ transport system substrate-binding protein/surface adhesin
MEYRSIMQHSYKLSVKPVKHAHGDHHNHTHDHSHDHHQHAPVSVAAMAPVQAGPAMWSLLRASVGVRLMIALALAVLVWGAALAAMG